MVNFISFMPLKNTLHSVLFEPKMQMNTLIFQETLKNINHIPFYKFNDVCRAF